MVSFGFIDCISNDFDSFEAAQNALGKYIGHSATRLTAPEILKIPVCAKKMLAKNDAVITFITATVDEFDELHLIMEKIIDLEVESGKYVFYCILDRSEYTTKENFNVVANKRLEALIDFALKAIDSPKEISSQVGSGFDFAALSSSIDLFNPEAASATQQTSQSIQEEPFATIEPKTEDEESKSLF